jgi:hypothetical protein
MTGSVGADFTFVLNKFKLAIARAERLLADKVSSHSAIFAVGPRSVLFTELEANISPLIKTTLVTPTDVNMSVDVNIVADYTGWHIHEGFGRRLIQDHGLTFLRRAAAAQGLMFSYYEPTERWDVYDVNKSLGIRLQPDIDADPAWEASSPLTHFCAWIAAQADLAMMHGGTISLDGKTGILLVGQGGSGKSGITLECILNGFSSVGDDYVLVSTLTPYMVYPLNRTVKQDSAGLERLGWPVTGTPNWQGKYLLSLSQLLSPKPVRPFQLTAIVQTQIVDHPTEFMPCSTQECFKALAIPLARQLAIDLGHHFTATASFVRNLPCYKLLLQRFDPDLIALLTRFSQAEKVEG